MTREVDQLKERIFGNPKLDEILLNQPDNGLDRFSIEEIMEFLTRQDKKNILVVSESEKQRKDLEELSSQALLVESHGNRSGVLLYDLGDSTYYIYRKSKIEQEKKIEAAKYAEPMPVIKEEKTYGLFMPTGLVVRRVSQGVLGNGVLGRAFITQNYIEILEQLMGDEFMEVLTHEVLHILYPDKKEVDIRQLTVYQLGNKTIYH